MPVALADGCDVPWLANESGPRTIAMIGDVFARCGDPA